MRNGTNIVSRKSIEDLVIELEKQKLKAKQDRIAHLCLELEEMKLELNRFKAEYSVKVGKFMVDLDKLNLELEEYSLRINIATSNPDATDEDIEREIEETLKDAREKTMQNEKEIKQAQKEVGAFALSQEDREEMRRLYLQLAKKYHPDKAEDKQKGQRMMSIINKAYEDGDIEMLRRLSVDVGDEIEENSKARKIELIRRESARLDRVIAELREDMEGVRRSPIYTLKNQVESAKKRGEDLLEKMASDMKSKIKMVQMRLNLVRARFESIMNFRKRIRGAGLWL